MRRVGFLYNHDAAHQVAHLAGIMAALTEVPGVEVHALVTRPAADAVARALVGPVAEQRIVWHRLRVGPLARSVGPMLDTLFPFTRLRTLDDNLPLFTTLDAIVSSERTCTRIKRRLGGQGPRLIHVPHGSGDRNVAHHPQLREFDLTLVSGRKLIDNGVALGLFPPERAAIIGYPKFDTVDLTAQPRLFPNDNPTILYNPHFDPRLSSVYRFGGAVLDLFARRPDWNLIFAPHVMYGRKRVHYSLEFKQLAWRRAVPARYRNLLNIHVDLGSPASIDMTYTLAADLYLGDVSSQLYEFLARPRPCIFLDSHQPTRWQDDVEYQFWHNGPVVSRIETLERLIEGREAVGERYRATQRRLFDYTIDLGSEGAGVRGARAIAEYLA